MLRKTLVVLASIASFTVFSAPTAKILECDKVPAKKWRAQWDTRFSDKACPNVIAASCSYTRLDSTYFVFDFEGKDEKGICLYKNRRTINDTCGEKQVRVAAKEVACKMTADERLALFR